jgi:hypothetical protein
LLTELTGPEIVVGKLLATSLNAFYSLIAILPLFAYPLLIGGVMPGEFWRLTLVLAATMFFSLSIGSMVSALCRETRTAMAATLALLLGFTALPPALASLAPLGSGGWIRQLLSSPSPVRAWLWVFDANFQARGGFWSFAGALVTLLTIAVLALWLAGQFVPTKSADEEPASDSWRSRVRQIMARPRASRPSASPGSSSTSAWKPDNPQGPQTQFRHERWLEEDPFAWLAAREQRPRLLVRTLMAVLGPAWLVCIAGCFQPSPSARLYLFGGATLISFGLHQGLKWLIALEASRQLNQDRRSGSLELLLVTPLSIDQIVRGQKRALRAIFLVPMLLVLATNLGLLVVLIALDPLPAASFGSLVCGEVLVGGALMLLVDFYALGWVGMWMALRNGPHHRAILATLVRVMLAPWLAVVCLVLMTMGGVGLPPDSLALFVALWFGLAAVLEHTFAGRAKLDLFEQLRQPAYRPGLGGGAPEFAQLPTALNPEIA